MPYTNLNEVLRHGKEHGYAAGAFNVVNMEMIQAVIDCAEKNGVGAVVQIYWENDLDHLTKHYAVAMTKAGAENASVPIALQLDHGCETELLKGCIDAGFSSVMADFSAHPYEKNIELTREIVEYAHAKGATVEAELGQIVLGTEGKDEISSHMTDPAMVSDFLEKTGVDALAVAIGTAHGVYSEAPVIDFERLEKILSLASKPIVVHGGSKVPDEDVKRMARLGISKLNIGFDLMNAFQQSIKETTKTEGFVAPVEIFSAGKEAVAKVLDHKISLLSWQR
jgi:ketose-bisphosphate aldolase